MPTALNLAIKSLRNRRVTTLLTIFSIALSVTLLLGVERIRTGARDSFSQTISQTDLIVGARGGNLSLLLYSVFQMGNPTNNISMESYHHFTEHPAVKWTIPISLGDSHRGFRVIATTRDFLDHYCFGGNRHLEVSEGRWNKSLFDVVLGADVARQLGYKIGDPIIIAHGISSGPTLFEHTQTPFHVVGILGRTTNPVDRGLYISLEAMEAIHVGWKSGVPSSSHQSDNSNIQSPPQFTPEELKPTQITAFFAAANARTDALRLMREINDYQDEPLMAIVPAITLSELWDSLSYAEASLQVIAGFVVAVSLLGMLIAIYTTLNERRREISILRAIGGSKPLTVILFTVETLVLTVVGCTLGVALLYVLLFSSQSIIRTSTGVYLPIEWLGQVDFLYIVSIIATGLISGFFIGLQAHRNSLADGLMIRI